MEKTPRPRKEEEAEEVNKPQSKPDSFKEFVRRIVAVPKEELNKQEAQYQLKRKRKGRK